MFQPGICAGDFTVIMGPSGAGKSTLLYCLSGMDALTGGQVLFKGQDISRLPEKGMAKLRAREFGFVFQQTHLVSNLTLFENAAVAGYAGKTDDVDDRAVALLEQINVGSAKDRLPNQVSGGEAQRAAIVRHMGTADWRLPIYHYDDYENWEVMQYYDIPSRYEIPSHPESVTSEKAGEVYYSEPNRIVLFYGDAEVSAEYTPVGYFDATEEFIRAVEDNPVLEGWRNKIVLIDPGSDEPGDIILYQGNSIAVYYDENTWNFTRLGKVQGVTNEELRGILGEGDVEIAFSLSNILFKEPLP